VRFQIGFVVYIILGMLAFAQAEPSLVSQEDLKQAIKVGDTELAISMAKSLAHRGKEEDIRALVEYYIPYTKTLAVRQKYRSINMNYIAAEKIYKADATDYLVSIIKDNPPDNISDNDTLEFAGKALVRIATEKSIYPLLGWARDASDINAAMVESWMDGLRTDKAVQTATKYLQQNTFRSKAIRNVFVKYTQPAILEN